MINYFCVFKLLIAKKWYLKETSVFLNTLRESWGSKPGWLVGCFYIISILVKLFNAKVITFFQAIMIPSNYSYSIIIICEWLLLQITILNKKKKISTMIWLQLPNYNITSINYSYQILMNYKSIYLIHSDFKKVKASYLVPISML